MLVRLRFWKIVPQSSKFRSSFETLATIGKVFNVSSFEILEDRASVE
jgi:hypothetical protein